MRIRNRRWLKKRAARSPSHFCEALPAPRRRFGRMCCVRGKTKWNGLLCTTYLTQQIIFSPTPAMFYGCSGMHNWQTIAKPLVLSLPRRTPHDHAPCLVYQHVFYPPPRLITPSVPCLISAVFWRFLKSDQQIREHLLGHCGSRQVSDAVEKLESVGKNLRLGATASFCFWSS